MRQSREKAVALRYRPDEDRAPKVVAKGEGLLARTIREAALRNNIPLRRDDALVELLSEIEIDRDIPPELYNAVAQLLSWIYRANNALSKESTLP